jgi:hypothetical protein
MAFNSRFINSKVQKKGPSTTVNGPLVYLIFRLFNDGAVEAGIVSVR